jgi:hypothetical protein
MKVESTGVVTASATATALDAPPPDYINRSGNRGSESVAHEDVAIPRLEIVQALSPIRKNNPNATEGMLYNSVTGEVYGNEVYIVPVSYTKQYLVWKDRKKGGGFRGAFSSDAEAKQRLSEVGTGGENVEDYMVIETPTHLCMMLRSAGTAPIVEQIAIAMPRTKMKVNRKWNAMIQIAGGDRFSRVYKVGSIEETNATNQSYFNFEVTPYTWTPEPVYRRAEDMWQRVTRGGVVVNHESVANEEVAGGGTGAPEI